MKNYVKEYKGFPVPEGATHVSDFPTPQPIEFYRAIGGEHQFFNTGAVNPVWCKSVFTEPNKWEIELPEAPQKWNGEGVPPVGVECEVDIEKSIGLSKQELELNGEKVTVISNVKNKRGFDITVFEISDGGVFCFSSKLFRPLKTQQEKDRDSVLIDALVECGYDADEFDLCDIPSNNHEVLTVMNILYKKGFLAAPKASGNDK